MRILSYRLSMIIIINYYSIYRNDTYETENQTELSKLRTEKKILDSKIKTLENDYNMANEERESLNKKATEKQKEVSKLKDEKNELEMENEELKRQISQLTKENKKKDEKLNSALESQQNEFGTIASENQTMKSKCICCYLYIYIYIY